MNSKYRFIRKSRVLDYLVDKGFKVVGTQRDYKFPNRYVWKFVRTPELEKAIDDYYKSIPENK